MYDVCCQAKQTHIPFPRSSILANDCFNLIHCDIWGPYPISTLFGARYFLTIVDDFSRATWVYLFTDKG